VGGVGSIPKRTHRMKSSDHVRITRSSSPRFCHPARNPEDNTAGRLAVKVIDAGDLGGLDQPQFAAVERVPAIMHRDLSGPIGIT